MPEHMGIRTTRRALGAGLGLALAAPFIGRAGAQTVLEWVAGPPGSAWYAMATGLANLVQEEATDLRLRIVPGGAAANPTRVQNGLSQIGFGLDFLCRAAAEGQEPFDSRHDRLATLGSGYASTEHHFIRRLDGPEDMQAIVARPGARIGVPQRASSDELAFQRILRFYGTGPEKLRAAGGRYMSGSYNDLIAAWNDKQIDYVYMAVARPAAPVIEISQGRRRAALVPFPPALLDHMSRTYGFSQGRIPLGTYPGLQTDDIPVMTMDTVILAAAALPDAIAEQITAIFVRNAGSRLAAIHPWLAAFDPRTSCRFAGVRLHPGAAAAFAPTCVP